MSGSDFSHGSVTRSRHASTKRADPRTRNGREWNRRTVGSTGRVSPTALCCAASSSTTRDERVLPLLVILGRENVEQGRPKHGSRVELREREAEPLAVRRVPPLEQESKTHHVAGEPRRHHARTELVADLGRAADERLLLIQSPPLARKQPEPDVVRVPGQRVAHRRELAARIVEDRARGQLEESLLRRAKPLTGRDAATRIEPERPLQPLAERDDLDVVRHRHVVPAEARRPAVERVRQARARSPLARPSRARARRRPAAAAPSRGRSTAPCRSRVRPIPSRAGPPRARRRRRAARSSHRRTRGRARDRERSAALDLRYADAVSRSTSASCATSPSPAWPSAPARRAAL